MGARRGINLGDNVGVAGVAGGLYIAFKGDIKRLVRVGMAAKAVFQRKMGFPLMAGGTFGDQRTFFGSGRMGSGMTVETGNF